MTSTPKRIPMHPPLVHTPIGALVTAAVLAAVPALELVTPASAAVGGRLGGRLVYRHRVAVQPVPADTLLADRVVS